MRKNKKNNIDVLEEKRRRLNTYTDIFNNAVSVVTAVIDKLEEANIGIDQTISDIEDYQEELSKTACGLQENKKKNEIVIKNFKSLLE